jgi:hypothetical protein
MNSVGFPKLKGLVKEKNPFSFYDDYQNLQHSITWKPNVLRVTSTHTWESSTWKPNVLGVTFTQTWKITSMWKFSFYEHLSSWHWPISEENSYLQVQILHRCVVSSLWAKPINAWSWFPISMGCHMCCRQS